MCLINQSIIDYYDDQQYYEYCLLRHTKGTKIISNIGDACCENKTVPICDLNLRCLSENIYAEGYSVESSDDDCLTFTALDTKQQNFVVKFHREYNQYIITIDTISPKAFDNVVD